MQDLKKIMTPKHDVSMEMKATFLQNFEEIFITQ